MRCTGLVKAPAIAAACISVGAGNDGGGESTARIATANGEGEQPRIAC